MNGELKDLNPSGYAVLSSISPGSYRIFVENPFHKWFFTVYNVTPGINLLNISLRPATRYIGSGNQYPWVQIGPAGISNPFDQGNSIYFNASGHIGLIQIDPLNPSIIYMASGTASDGIMGPISVSGNTIYAPQHESLA